MNNDTKIWKKVTYPGVRKDYYMISEDGELMTICTMKKMIPYTGGDYPRFHVIPEEDTSKTRQVLAHRLVAWEFVPNPENHPIVDHLDGEKYNLHYTNLEWVTHKENTRRAREMGLINDQGYNHSSSIFTEELARSICERLEKGWKVKEIFRWLSKNSSAKFTENYPLYQFILRLKHRIGWDNVTCDYEYPSYDEKRTGKWDKEPPGTGKNIYTEAQIREVCIYLEVGKSCQDILEILTGSRAQKDNRKLYDFIDGIRRHRHWTEISCEYNIDNNSTPARNTGWDQKIADWVDGGLSKKEIRIKLKAVDPTFNNNTAARVDRMIDRYVQFKKMDSNIQIRIIDN